MPSLTQSNQNLPMNHMEDGWILEQSHGSANKEGQVCWERSYKRTPLLTMRAIGETPGVHCHCKPHCAFQKKEDTSPLFLMCKVEKVFLDVLNVGTHFYFNQGLEKGCSE